MPDLTWQRYEQPPWVKLAAAAAGWAIVRGGTMTPTPQAPRASRTKQTLRRPLRVREEMWG